MGVHFSYEKRKMPDCENSIFFHFRETTACPGRRCGVRFLGVFSDGSPFGPAGRAGDGSCGPTSARGRASSGATSADDRFST